MMLGRCCYCAGGLVNLRCYGKNTGFVLWEACEEEPLVDEAGDIWTVRWGQVSSDAVGFTYTGSGFRSLPHQFSTANDTIYDRYVRKLTGTTGALATEYTQPSDVGFDNKALWGSEQAQVNYGELINSSGQALVAASNVSSRTLFIDEPGNATGLVTYYMGPMLPNDLGTVTLRAGAYAGGAPVVPLPGGVVDAVLNGTDSAATIDSTITSAFGAAVSSVTVTTGTGATLNTGQMKIVIQWGHPHWYLAQMKIVDAGSATAASAYVWDCVNAVVDSAMNKGYRTSALDPDTHVWGAGSLFRWCDNGTVSCRDEAGFNTNNPNYNRIVNFDVSGATATVNWSKGLFTETADPTDTEPLPVWDSEIDTWDFIGLNTAGGHSRAFYSNLSETQDSVAGNRSFLSDYMTQVVDGGTGWKRYTGTERPNGTEGYGLSSQARLCCTSTTQSGFMIHSPREMDVHRNTNLAGGTFHGHASGKMFADRIIDHTSRYDDAATTNAAQAAQAGLATFMRRPQGFDATYVYVAGKLADPTKDAFGANKPEPVSVASAGFVGPAHIDMHYTVAANVENKFFVFSSTEQFDVASCQWRITFYNPGLNSTAWFAHDDSLATVNTALIDQYGTDALSNPSGGPSDQPVWFTELTTPESQGMVWQHDVNLNIVAHGLSTQWPGHNVPSEWHGNIFSLLCRVELKDIVRSSVKEIGRIAWDASSSDWSKNWPTGSVTSSLWGRLFADCFFVWGPKVGSEVLTCITLRPDGNGSVQDWDGATDFSNIDEAISQPTLPTDGLTCDHTSASEVYCEWTVPDVAAVAGGTVQAVHIWVYTPNDELSACNAKIDGTWLTEQTTPAMSVADWDQYEFDVELDLSTGLTDNQIRCKSNTGGDTTVDVAYMDVCYD